MFDPLLTSAWDPRAQLGPQIDIFQRRAREDFLNVLVYSLSMPKI